MLLSVRTARTRARPPDKHGVQRSAQRWLDQYRTTYCMEMNGISTCMFPHQFLAWRGNSIIPFGLYHHILGDSEVAVMDAKSA
ncbi:hypothetical protein FJTKL_09362 [Diaporthe vaccinii]|uniref:Uncharacterized protein n=1 Tax=Diaporthe vaccinii TaxID=105482 RepID=A0ABR4FCG1_9PEZI